MNIDRKVRKSLIKQCLGNPQFGHCFCSCNMNSLNFTIYFRVCSFIVHIIAVNVWKFSINFQFFLQGMRIAQCEYCFSSNVWEISVICFWNMETLYNTLSTCSTIFKSFPASVLQFLINVREFSIILSANVSSQVREFSINAR